MRKRYLLSALALVGIVALAGGTAYATGVLDSVLPGTCTIGQTGDAATVTIEGVGAHHACDTATRPTDVGGPGLWIVTRPSHTDVLCSYRTGSYTVTVRWSQSGEGFGICSAPFDPGNFDPKNPTEAASYVCLTGHCGRPAEPAFVPIPSPTPYGWIIVTVTDPTSNPLPGVTASLTGTTSTVVTDAAGHSYLPVPGPGNFKLVISTPTTMYFCTGFQRYNPASPLYSPGESVSVVLAPTQNGC